MAHQEGADHADALRVFGLVDAVAVVGEAPGAGEAPRRGDTGEPRKRRHAHRADQRARLGVALADRVHRRVGEVAVLAAGALGAENADLLAVGSEALPGAAIGFIPDLKEVDTPAVARDNGHDIAMPGFSLLVGVDGRAARRAEDARGVGVVESVAVAEADPGAASCGDKVVDD